jgi:two-component system, OmpR family, sensor histidine kinase TctE
MSTPQLSLKRQLLLWLLVPQILLWLVGGTLAYRIALSHAEKAIDQSLTQSVRSLARQVKPVGSGLLIDFPKAAQAIMEEDPQDKVSYMVSSPPGQFVLGNATLPEPPEQVRAALRTPGLQSAGNGTATVAAVQIYQAMVEDSGGTGREVQREVPREVPSEPARELRIAAFEIDYGETQAPQRMRVQVAKSLAVRERIARELISDMLIPLVLLGAALGVLVYTGIVRGLKPLARLQAQLGEKGAASGSVTTPTLAPIEMRQAPQEVHSLAGAVNQLLAAVQRSVSQEKRFINDAAHQLRTPLAGIQAQLDLARTDNDPQTLQGRMTKISAGVERSTHLVHQLLRLARSEADIKLQALDLALLAREAAREAVPRALAAGVDLGYEGAESGVWVRGHALLLHEALANVLDNALRYGKNTGQESHVTIRVRCEGEQALLEVQDNGPGLDAAERLLAFERFHRAPSSQSTNPDGAGLGLAIVREIAQRHRGTAQIVDALEADANTGLCVRISLPLALALNQPA